MILTCPECTTRFAIDPEAIGPNGRTVRCSQCSATWFAAADPDILSLNEIQSASSAEINVADNNQNDSDGADFANAQNDDPSEQSTAEPHTAMRDKAERKKVRRRLFGVGMIWVTTLGILALAALLAWLFRAQIVEKFPSTRPLYQSIGIEASETGLKIHDVRTEYGENEGTPVLIVNGVVENYDLKARDLPMIQMNFKNDNDEVLANWVIEPSKTILAKGESLNFSSQYPNPPIDATKLVPVFVDESGGGNAVPMTPQ